MSQMFNEQVGVDFNVGGNFQATLSQMIAQSDQYAKSADTLIGRIASLNVVTTGLIKSTAGLTQVNKVATAEAAAYEQQLSGIAATAAVTGKSFSALSNTTLALARSTGNLGQSVRIVEALGTSGVTSERSIDKLAKTFAQLGAAHGLDPVAIGQGLLNLNRAFGNSEAMVKGYGDTLTTLTKRYGASVDGALGFAKALAPVAASVGVSESAVLGLGTAASRLGEEGYAGANAFNKVLLDMSHSIRDGTPEIRTYAGVLGTTTERLRDLFKADPTEVLVRFTEAIGKGGPQASRALDMLGLDATRTVRALTALSSQGNLRQIINDAAASFNNDATARAARTALGGVNDEAAKLQQTLSQTVSAAGQPFLGFLGQVLRLANQVSDAIRGIVSSDIVQKLGVVGAVIRTAFGASTSIVTGLGLAGIARLLIVGRRGTPGGLVEQVRQYRAALAEARPDFIGPRREPGTEPDLGFAGRAGQFVGEQFPEPIFPRRPLQMRAGMFARAFRGVENVGALAITAQTRLMDPLTGRETPYSMAGQAARESFSRVGRDISGSGLDIRALGRAAGDSAKTLGLYARDVTAAANASQNLVGSLSRLGVQSGRAIGELGREGGGLARRGLGRLVGAVGPETLAIGGALAGIEIWQSVRADQAAKAEEAKQGFTDANRVFNEFAAAAGEASQGLVSLAEATKESTKQIADSNKQITETYQLNANQLRQAQAPGYTRAFTPVDTRDPRQVAIQARLMLGSNPTAGQLGRVGIDIENYLPGQGQNVLNQIQGLNRPGVDLYRASFQALGRSQTLFGQQSDEGARLQELINANATNAVQKAIDVYGPTAQPVAAAQEAAKAYRGARGLGTAEQESAAKVVAKMLGFEGPEGERYVSAALQKGYSFEKLARYAAQGMGIGEGPGESGTVVSLPRNVGALPTAATAAATAIGTTGTGNIVLPGLNALDQQFSAVNGKLTTFGTSLYGAQEAARKLGTTVEKLTPEQIAKLDPIAAAMARYIQDNSAVTRAQAGLAVYRGAAGTAGGNVPMTMAQLLATQAATPATSVEQQYAQADARQLAASTQALRNRTLITYQRQQQEIGAGRFLRGLGTLEDPDQEAARKAGIDQYHEDLAQRIDMRKQFLQADKELGIQWGRQQEEAQIQVSRGWDAFYRQRGRAQRDFNKQVQYMVEDNAKAIYDPYQRIQAQSVWDSQSLLANLAEQNTAIARQTGQLGQLRRMGLSQQATDLLKLSDPAQAQQVSRLLEEAAGSPQILRQINLQASQRLAVTRQATVNENNVQYRRSLDQFHTSLADTEKDFRIGLSQMNEDLARSHLHAQEDLARMFDENGDSLKTMSAKYVAAIANLPPSAQKMLSANLRLMTKTAMDDSIELINSYLDPYGANYAGLTAALLAGAAAAEKASHGAGERSSTGRPPAGGQPPSGGPNTFTAPAISASAVRSTLPHNVSEAFAFGASEDAHASRNWHGMCDNFVARAYGLSHSGYATAKTHWAGIPPGYKGGGTPPAGALVFWGNGADGHVALSVGNGNVYTTDFIRDGQVDVAHIADISRNWGGYRGWSFPYFGGKTAPISMGDGGIALRAGRYELAERGRGEAVIPLDGRGAAVLAETMTRYADRAAETRIQPYATHISHGGSYVYDQRVQVLGPVTVPANDPDAFIRKVDERARQARLVQPVGRG